MLSTIIRKCNLRNWFAWQYWLARACFRSYDICSYNLTANYFRSRRLRCSCYTVFSRDAWSISRGNGNLTKSLIAKTNLLACPDSTYILLQHSSTNAFTPVPTHRDDHLATALAPIILRHSSIENVLRWNYVLMLMLANLQAGRLRSGERHKTKQLNNNDLWRGGGTKKDNKENKKEKERKPVANELEHLNKYNTMEHRERNGFSPNPGR